MRKPLVAGNWKMHGSRSFVADHLESLKTLLAGVSTEVAVFPPSVYLSVAATVIEQGARAISLGAQDLSPVMGEGAYTGEISGAMLRDAGCRFVLVGHSERRARFGETSTLVADKFGAALQAGLIPLLCVGETLQERQSGSTAKVVRNQIEAVVNRVGVEPLAAAVIAYEPVWAIGTGLTASPRQAQDVHAAIREQLGTHGELTRMLYGGSVKAANAEELFSQPDIDGGLIGGASLIADEFAAICRQADQR